MRYAPAMWVLGPADSGNSADLVRKFGHAGFVSEIFRPAVPLGVHDFIIRAPGSVAGVPKSLQDLHALTSKDRQAFRMFTLPNARDGRSRNRVTFYAWLGRSARQVDAASYLRAVDVARQCGAGLCFDDWPHTPADLRGLVDEYSGRTPIAVEPNWTNADAWCKRFPCMVAWSLWQAWKDKPEHDWLLERTDAMPMRTLLYNFAPTDDRKQVLKNCVELVAECDRTNSRAALPDDIVRFGIDVREITYT